MIAPNRCRLVIVVPEILDISSTDLAEVLAGGDVASVIIASPSNTDFRSRCENLVPVIQKAGAAAIIANDTQLAGRCNADGIHLDLPGGEAGVPALAEAVARFAPLKIVGAGGANTRHMSLSLGETGPDYVFFGKLDGDIKPQTHPKLRTLAEWWSELVEVPGICMAGRALESVVEVARTGIDFVALSSAIFFHEKGGKHAVCQTNVLLDENAPEFNHE